jgi:hypothetical protein
MDGRFKTLESKLNLIQDNLKVGCCACAACFLLVAAPPACFS